MRSKKNESKELRNLIIIQLQLILDSNDLLRFSTATHFLPRTSTEHLAPAAKEDEVTSSEEAGKFDDRIELKKCNYIFK